MAIDFAQAAGPLFGTGSAPTLAQVRAVYPKAKRKRHFTITVGTVNPIQVSFTNGRIASVLVPNGSIWVGGDNSVSSTGPSGGIPLISGQPFICGLEEGDSETWLIATAATTVACMEFLP